MNLVLMIKQLKMLFIAAIYFMFSGCSETPTKEPLNPQVDERVELMSILARLADFQEYNDQTFESYVANIESKFGTYRNMEVISIMQELRQSTGLAYDAIMKMAINLKIGHGSLGPVSDITEEEERWPAERTAAFYEALNDFYQKTGFHDWFEGNQSVYDSIRQRAKILAEIDQGWFYDYFGSKSQSTFRLVIGPGNGYGNYGPQVTEDGQRIIYAIIGCGQVDKAGFPVLENSDLKATVIHEFCHSYVNPIVNENYDLFRESAAVLYAATSEEMNQQAYTDPKTVIYESLVRASVIQYMIEHEFSRPEIGLQKAMELSSGFYWILDLVEACSSYQTDRETFPKMESFMPEFGRVFSRQSQTIMQDRNNFLNTKASVVSTSPRDGATVNVNMNEISFTFDGELIPLYYGFGPRGPQEEEVPQYSDIIFSDSTITLRGVELKPNTQYKFWAHGRFFSVYDGRLVDSYSLTFKTN